ncbi:hypothetical protein BsWGS_17381 [Bradybaena similaris]
MQSSNINFDDILTSISEFFTPKQFAKMSEYEKKHLSNLRQNFEALRQAGIEVTPPDFMCKNLTQQERQEVLESSGESDADWTPALEQPRTHGVNQSKRLIQKKAYSKDNPKEKVPGPTQRKKQRKKLADLNIEEEHDHVYSFRTKRLLHSMSLTTPDDDDDFLYCEECKLKYDGDCPVHGPLLPVDDVEVQQTCPSEPDEYIKTTLPEGLVFKKSNLPGAGLGVFAARDFPALVGFGPYKGKKIFKEGQTSDFVDDKYLWMKYVNCARHKDEQCVTAYKHNGEICYRSLRPILAGTEILVQRLCPSEADEFSKKTLPEGLVIKKSKIPRAGLGVFAAKDFPARARFGPYRGQKEVNKTIAHKSGYSWQILKQGLISHFVDGKDPSTSNWMRYVNCARHEDEQCVTAYQHRGEIYYRSHRPIVAGTEILVSEITFVGVGEVVL